jgi:hypothetical protein
METEILNILYDISYAKTAQLNNVYLYNDNFVFECTPLDLSNNFDISLNFLKYLESPGFIDVSAVATLDISATILNDIFLFQDGINEEFVYGINNMTNKNLNIIFSQAKITKKYLNNEILDITLVDDYIESIVETITGVVTHSPGRIIKNIVPLKTFITSLDTSFNIQITNIFQNYYDLSLNQTPKTLNIYKTNLNVMEVQCKNLITGVLNMNKTIPNTLTSRQEIFLQDLVGQTPPYSFVFKPGDKLAIRITYNPTYITNISTTSYTNRRYITSRSYKIFLNVIN